MYSDISNLINSIPKIEASCRAISVLPTPVGPANRNDPIVLLSSLSPALESFIALPRLTIALSCPKITLFRSLSIFFRDLDSSFDIDFSGILVIFDMVFSISI